MTKTTTWLSHPTSTDTVFSLGNISHQLENSSNLGRPVASPPADGGSVLARNQILARVYKERVKISQLFSVEIFIPFSLPLTKEIITL